MTLYSEIFYSSEVAGLFSDRNFVTLMLRVESALARAQAMHGLVPDEAAGIIADCCNADRIDFEKLGTGIKLGGNAAIPLVGQLTRMVHEKSPEASKYVHLGATSQDVMDTAMVLLIQDFIGWVEGKLALLEKTLVATTRKHRSTLMIGRTLLQQARPITFGLKTAGWLESISRSGERISEAKKRVPVVQLSGAVGSGNTFISKDVQATFARLLGLQPARSWHTHRDNFAEFAAVLGILAGSLAKIATDVVLLMQTEVGEVFEGAAEGKGGSSTMPHKRNPVTCAAVLANTHRIPHLVASILSAMPQEHERSAGLWHSEWETLADIMQLTAGALDRSIELTEGLEADEKRMLQNLELTNGLIYAENVSLALAPALGKAPAHELVEKACQTAVARGEHLKKVLTDIHIDLSNKELDELFKPENSIGFSLEIIDAVLQKFESNP
ncbi:MAG: 3-carboxy-cis,cis-muconate cycloisomerase [Saprospiraceae bacterium]|nr:3-carboxy-cis,cis-muconate cycloisomerase [Saprospiraceae bacterium]